jgi:hypothetical protein
MLIRNLDVTQGLCNGTRLQIQKMGEENMKCRILTGPKTGRVVLIPKIKFEYGQGRHHRGLRFRRLQFPIRPCFAMTVNKVGKNLRNVSSTSLFKAQGQTLQRMALVLNGKQCFSHGQVYVAMSRVTSINGIRVFSPSTCRGGKNAIENVVYHELLDDAQIVPRPQHTDYDPNAQAGAAEVRDLESDEEMFFD